MVIAGCNEPAEPKKDPHQKQPAAKHGRRSRFTLDIRSHRRLDKDRKGDLPSGMFQICIPVSSSSEPCILVALLSFQNIVPQIWALEGMVHGWAAAWVCAKTACAHATDNRLTGQIQRPTCANTVDSFFRSVGRLTHVYLHRSCFS